MGPHEPSKQFQNLLDIYSVVSRELTTLWFRNLDINYKRSQNIGWNEHKSWPWSSSRINHKTFNGLSTQHEKQYLGILHGSREKWYESYSLLIRKQPTSRDANGTGFPVKWRVWWTSAEVNSILMTCHHPDLGDKQKFKSSAEGWHWLQIVFCLIFLWWGLLGAVRLPARPHCRYNKQKQVVTKSSAKTPNTQQPSEWCQPLGLAESKQTSWETTKYGKGWPQYMLVKGYLF